MATVTQNSAPIRTAWNVLYFTFGIVPIVAGLDKFTNLLVDWSLYLWPVVPQILPVSAEAFMMIVGVIEIMAGIVVFVRPRIGGYIVSAWLVLIAINLILQGYYDIAVRDITMALAAVSLASLSE